jgi:transcription elongation factor GreA-like protein
MAEKEYVASAIQNNPSNIGNLWEIIRRCIPRKSLCRKIFTKDENVVANEFNQFFNSVGEKTVDKIKSLAQEYNYEFAQHPFVPRSFPLEQQFSFKPCSRTI